MEAVAGNGLCQLNKEDVDVTVAYFAQHRTGLELLNEVGGGYAQCNTGTLNRAGVRRERCAKSKLCAQHSFASNQVEFQRFVARDLDDERYEAGQWKIYMVNMHFLFSQAFAKLHRHRFAVREELAPLRSRKRIEQPVSDCVSGTACHWEHVVANPRLAMVSVRSDCLRESGMGVPGGVGSFKRDSGSANAVLAHRDIFWRCPAISLVRA